MKKTCIRILSVVLILTLLLGNLALMSFAAQKNTGTRHEPCLTLSSQAVAYYQKNGFDYETYTSYEGEASGSCLAAVNSELFGKLHDLMANTMTNSITYKSLTSYWPDTDRSNGSSNAILFYSDKVSGSYNREHVWPKSRASFLQTLGGADLHHLRPTNSTVNSTRSNYCFGNVKMTSGYDSYEYSGNTVIWYDGDYMENSSDRVGNDILGLVEVNDNIKGDVARILLYVYVRWVEPNLFENTSNPVVGSDDNENVGLRVMYNLDTLLQWCQIDPVDTWEMSRNDATESVQGNRNIFIDYPEFAWLLFGREVGTYIEENVVPNGSNGSSGGSSGGGNTGGAIPEGENVAIFNNTYSVALSTETTVYTSSSGSSKNQLKPVSASLNGDKLSVEDETVALFSVKTTDDGITTFVTKDGKYLESDGTNLGFADAPNSNTEFILEPVNGGYYVKLANFKYQGTKDQYLEYYNDKSAFTVYGMGSNTGMYTFNFYVVDNEGGGSGEIPTPCRHENVSYVPAVEYCAQDGTVAYYYCADCKLNFADQACTTQLSKSDMVLAPVGHNWNEGVVSIAPTATQTGLKIYTCLRCSHAKTELIPATGEEEPKCDGGATCPGKIFTDMPESWYWSHEGIDYAVKHQLFKGMTETTFGLDIAMTRGMLVTVLWRNEGSPIEGSNSFTDVASDAWYAEAVAWAAENGIVTGIGDGTFAPDKEISREQIATILFRYAKFKDFDTDAKGSLAQFPDANIANDYAIDALQWAVAEGYINGVSVVGQSYLQPLGFATRSQVATILMRFLEAN